MILCDTSVFFQLFHENAAIEAELGEIGYANLAICDITIGEIYFGMRKSEERETKELIRRFNRFSFTKDASRLFIEIMSDLASRQIGLPDALIAAIAKANGLDVFTLNIDDFKRVDGLKLYKPKRKLK
ncbi:MAG: PIN domain-containing protein [Cytophagaceae bacterium]|nr:PIN domain-containing protein [Cytophagaceae bacterium]